jgi:hypothetical protein
MAEKYWELGKMGTVMESLKNIYQMEVRKYISTTKVRPLIDLLFK